MPPTVPVNDELLLRAPKAEDALIWTELLSEANGVMAPLHREMSRWGEGRTKYGVYVIEHRPSGKAIGVAGLADPWDPRGAHLICVLLPLPEFRGRGFATRACNAILTWSERVGQLVFGHVDVENPDGRKLVTRLGGRPVGMREEDGKRLVDYQLTLRDRRSDLHVQYVKSRLPGPGFDHVKPADLEARDWWGIIASAGAPDRYWECFDLLKEIMTDLEYAETVREIWVATNGLPPSEAAARLLDHGRDLASETWMGPEDAERFRRLGEQVEIYRGCATGAEEGWSWTLERGAAEHFAAQVQPERAPVILRGRVSKDQIIALFSGGWDEAEVVVPGERVEIVESKRFHL